MAQHKQLLRSWQAAIMELSNLPQLLESLSSCPVTLQQQLDHVNALQARLQEFQEIDKLPESVLQKLVSAQVPQRLLAACSTAASTPHFLGRATAVSALKHFVAMLVTAGVRAPCAAAGGMAAASYISTSCVIAAAVGQQLQQSAFLQQLPGLCMEAAQLLQAAPLVPPPEAPVVLDGVQTHLWEAYAGGGVLPQLPGVAVQVHADMLLLLQASLSTVWPPEDCAPITGAAALVPAVQLALAAMQHVSGCLEQLPTCHATACPSGLLTALLTRAWMQAVNSLSQLRLERDLLAADAAVDADAGWLAGAVQCLGIIVGTQLCAEVLADAAGRAGRSSGGNSGGSSSSSGRPDIMSSADRRRHWVRACTMEGRVPAGVGKLLRGLGVSTRAALLAAAFLPDLAGHGVEVMLYYFPYLLGPAEDALREQAQREQSAKLQQPVPALQSGA